jgi:predicted transcriptional regulator
MMKYNPFKTGENVKTARVKAGLTPGQVAEQVHVSDEYYNRVEDGTLFPDLMTFVRICRVIDVEDPGQVISVDR